MQTNKLDVLNKQITNLQGLKDMYYSNGDFKIAQSFQDQINMLNDELLRTSISEAIKHKGVSW
jgi:hypothetical protein